MADKTLFGKYYSRVAREGFFKALCCGLIVGCSALIVSALAFWFFGVEEGLWISLGLFLVGTGASLPIFYFKKFRPTTKALAKRIDELGLEERILTMTELENDDSYIAMKQREDALKAIHSVDHMMIRIVVSASVLVAVCVTGVVGVGMTSVSALYYAGQIPSGKTLFDKAVTGDEEKDVYTVIYQSRSAVSGKVLYWDGADWQESEAGVLLDENGEKTVVGDKVTEGEDAPAVYAQPASGYMFVRWSDGVATQYRQDKAVSGDITVYAVFAAADGTDGTPDEPGDPGQFFYPSEPSNDPDAPPQNGSPSDTPPPPSPPSDPTNNSTSTNQTVIDGETAVDTVIDNASQEGMDKVSDDGTMPGDIKDGIGDYFGTIGG